MNTTVQNPAPIDSADNRIAAYIVGKLALHNLLDSTPDREGKSAVTYSLPIVTAALKEALSTVDPVALSNLLSNLA